MSLRARLTLTVLLLLAGGLVGVPLATWGVTKDVTAERGRVQLDTAARVVTPMLAAGTSLSDVSRDAPAGTMLRAVGAAGGAPSFFEVRERDGTVAETLAYDGAPKLPAKMPAELFPPPGGVRYGGDKSGGKGPPLADGGAWHLRASWLPDGRLLLVGVRTREMDSLVGRLTGVQSAITMLALVVLAVIAFRAIRRVLRPLDAIAAEAGAIGRAAAADGGEAAEALRRRVEPADERSEAGRLGLALNAMLGRIEAAFREREASEERLRRFVADASHELRTPVAAIRGYAELFRRGAASRPDDLAKTMSRIESEATRMGVLVDELLLLARLDQGRPLQRDPIEPGALAAEAVAAARAVDPGRPLTLSVTPVVVLGDAMRLRQVLDNLLANVRGHTPPGTPASVRVAVEGDTVVIEVADEGPGLTPEQRARVFERFYRADPGRSRDRGGAGLGLAIVAAVAAAHGGEATVRSEPGRGAAFTIRLPKAPTPAPVPTFSI
ncbi:two-component system OmpR family sensor kinase [Thermocatellispora tengchongensis]|uniref:histidine kinase n=1 Tax=Thermocatellispora tengchongensis TaxID=1073253 RepID=A0A840P674_9ACTN|nr:HAMP domain-containing sensor histidine kinase [Thermocatellispora tengchongensis]MBB5134076.1 two-component system OmpR family sensor kinase [Thermocatellispora tengchongensis]